MIIVLAADTWADFAGDVWQDPTARWIVYVLIVLAAGLAVWRSVRRIRAFLAEIRQDLGIVKHEVKNDHKTNFREEADTRHDQNFRALERIELKVGELAIAVGVHQYRLDQIDREVGITQDRRPEQ